MQKYRMWIGGQWVEAQSGKSFPVINPANSEEFATVSLGGKPEVDQAVLAARKAFPVWSGMPQAERSRILFQIADELKKRANEFAELETLDHGFPINLAKATIQGSILNFEYVAQAAKSLISDVLPVLENHHVFLRREPVGVTALITPWNVPLNIMATKLAFAMGVGNTCVVKPASIDCLSTLKFAEILEKTDLPPGAVNFLTGPGDTVGSLLASHPGIDMISFTGSSETGKAIISAGSSTVKRLQLELGGKNPFIVLEDADLDKAAMFGTMSVVMNSGQVCASPGRFYIQDKVYDQFVEKFVAGLSKIPVGDPMDPNIMMGPVASLEHRDKIESYIKSGIDEGARLVLGGKRPVNPPLDKGYYVMPTVFTEVKQNMKIAREEIFGPVACLIRFSTVEEIIVMANDSVYGLCASVWTKNTTRGIKCATQIQAGSVWVNSTPPPSPEIPWGGFKESGLGKESSRLGLEEMTQLKVIGVSLD